MILFTTSENWSLQQPAYLSNKAVKAALYRSYLQDLPWTIRGASMALVQLSRGATGSAARVCTSGRVAALVQKRSIHQVAPLPYAIDHGLAPLFSPKTLSTFRNGIQRELLTKVNLLVEGTVYVVHAIASKL